MTHLTRRQALAALAATAAASADRAAPAEAAVQTGRPAPAFSVTDTKGRPARAGRLSRQDRDPGVDQPRVPLHGEALRHRQHAGPAGGGHRLRRGLAHRRLLPPGAAGLRRGRGGRPADGQPQRQARPAVAARPQGPARPALRRQDHAAHVHHRRRGRAGLHGRHRRPAQPPATPASRAPATTCARRWTRWPPGGRLPWPPRGLTAARSSIERLRCSGDLERQSRRRSQAFAHPAGLRLRPRLPRKI